MKKIITKSLIIFASYYIVILLYACNPCDCPPRMYSSYSIDNLSLQNLEYTIQAGTAYTIRDGNSSEYQIGEYGFRFIFYLEKYAKNCRNDKSLLVTGAYACDCVVPIMSPKDSISDIVIKTKNDFNNSYLAGSDVTDLFVHLSTSYNSSQLIKKSLLESVYYDIDQSLNNVVINAYLDASPDTSRDVQFDVEVKLSNGNVLTGTTEKVYLKQ